MASHLPPVSPHSTVPTFDPRPLPHPCWRFEQEDNDERVEGADMHVVRPYIYGEGEKKATESWLARWEVGGQWGARGDGWGKDACGRSVSRGLKGYTRR